MSTTSLIANGPENANQKLRIAVISDVHGSRYTNEAKDETHFFTDRDRDDEKKNPLAALKKFISDKPALRADILLCPGDLSNKACAEGLQESWRAIHEIADLLGASPVIGTTGNHDVMRTEATPENSRPSDRLRSLKPAYPTDQTTLNTQYWGEDWFEWSDERCRVLCLNSAATHGERPGSHEHGCLTDLTLLSIERYLTQAKQCPINILLCHHHPHKHSELDLGDYDEMHNGQKLLLLLEANHGPGWLVVHGHKHHPKLEYASGSASAPIVLSAGSVSAGLYPKLGTNVRNQFHVLEFDLPAVQSLGLVGRVTSYSWAFGKL